MCLHGYQRNTVDVDLLIRPDDSVAVREALEADQFSWNAQEKEFRSPSGIAKFLLAGERAGKDSEVKLPDPSDAKTTTEIEEFARADAGEAHRIEGPRAAWATCDEPTRTLPTSWS